MILGGDELDKIVYEVLVDCRSVNPPLDRNEIAQHVIDQLSESIRKEVYASIERMVGNGQILANSGSDARQYHRYSLPEDAAGRH